MWVLTGERKCFCGIHISGKSIRIGDDAASKRIEHLFDTVRPGGDTGAHCQCPDGGAPIAEKISGPIRDRIDINQKTVAHATFCKPDLVATGSWCAAQLVRAETVALKGPMLPEVSTARTRK